MAEHDRDIDSKIENANAVQHIELSKRQKLGRNCKQFWWAWLGGFLLFVLVIVIVVIFGIIPPVAQKKIDSTTLQLNSMSILNSTPNSFSLSINGTIKGATGSAKHARLEKMNVKLFLEGHDPIQPILELPMDEIHGGDAVPVVKENVAVSIQDEAIFDEFALKLMENDLLRVAMRGRTRMWLGKINTMVNYNEVVTMKALNRLQGMVITAYELVLSNADYNVKGQVLIPNPAVLTLQIGDVGLTIGYKGQSLGTGVIPSLTLRPGNHTYEFTALIARDKLLNMATVAIAKESLTIGSTGCSINGVKIPWLSKPLEKLETLVPIDTKYLSARKSK